MKYEYFSQALEEYFHEYFEQFLRDQNEINRFTILFDDQIHRNKVEIRQNNNTHVVIHFVLQEFYCEHVK